MPTHRFILAMLLVALLSTGCVSSSSAPATDDIGRHGVGEQDRFRMMHYGLLDPRDGVTTRDDVLRLMGEPDAVTTDGSAMVHHWMAYAPEWLGLGGEPDDRPPLFGDSHRRTLRWYFFLTDFDPAGRLRRHTVQSTTDGDRSPQQALESWSQKPATRPG